MPDACPSIIVWYAQSQAAQVTTTTQQEEQLEQLCKSHSVFHFPFYIALSIFIGLIFVVVYECDTFPVTPSALFALRSPLSLALCQTKTNPTLASASFFAAPNAFTLGRLARGAAQCSSLIGRARQWALTARGPRCSPLCLGKRKQTGLSLCAVRVLLSVSLACLLHVAAWWSWVAELKQTVSPLYLIFMCEWVCVCIESTNWLSQM